MTLTLGKAPLDSEIERIGALMNALEKGEPKLKVLNRSSLVRQFPRLAELTKGLSVEEEIVVKSILAANQGEILFSPDVSRTSPAFTQLLENLLPIEKFYSDLGGLLGYHWIMLRHLSTPQSPVQAIPCIAPQGIDLSMPSARVKKAIRDGIAALPYLGEIYPIGGAADRLRLQDPKTGTPLPAACLEFAGKTLLEGLIQDLQAREYLYFQTYGRQIITPIAIMTSGEKENHQQVINICKQHRWFGRPPESFRFLFQPSVPTLTRSGDWCLQGPCQPLLKPGGHGVVWKLANDEGIFRWFAQQGRTKALIRQINNPVAGVDAGLSAFIGIGYAENKEFGVASCPRQVKAQEGMNVIMKKKGRDVLTCIEYCDFKKFQLEDTPISPKSPYSKYPSNTNILFVDLAAVRKALSIDPIPGTIVNVKKTTFSTTDGKIQELEIARLESSMQHISESIPLEKTYITFNDRKKTISCTKREFVLGASLLETPEGCFLDVLHNNRKLLVDVCKFKVPPASDPAAFFSHGPSFLFLYHPALGPLYSLIGKKLCKGRLAPGAELQLHIAQIESEHLDIEGSLLISTSHIMGSLNDRGILAYGKGEGKCTLKNVRVRNQGIDVDAPNVFWRNEITRKEACTITIEGNGEFIAEDIELPGNLQITVKPGQRLRAVKEKGKLAFRPF